VCRRVCSAVAFEGGDFHLTHEVTSIAPKEAVKKSANLLLYNLRHRGIEAGLLPWCRDRGIPIMAYSPIEQGRLLRDRVLTAVAIRHRATTAQIALAWVLRQPDTMVIPKAAT
jgi:diketogulonate reductase-like aldo/keto reductase